MKLSLIIKENEIVDYKQKSYELIKGNVSIEVLLVNHEHERSYIHIKIPKNKEYYSKVCLKNSPQYEIKYNDRIWLIRNGEAYTLLNIIKSYSNHYHRLNLIFYLWENKNNIKMISDDVSKKIKYEIINIFN